MTTSLPLEESATTLVVTERGDSGARPDLCIAMTYEQRQRSRLRLILADGTPLALMLARGERLLGGSTLRTRCGKTVLVEAAAEPLSVATADNALVHARACYHLGNRHLPLAIGSLEVRYLRDHVIDALALRLGLKLEHVDAPFQPEDGAYAGAHAHSHGH
ncbi:MAG: urease accessory protein UreE [Pseudomonadota bacterium]